MSEVEKIEAELRAGLEGVTPGPWMVYDGCSWRRIGTAHGRRDDCAVLAPTKASDGHPDLTCSIDNDRDANLEHIARCDPDTIRALLDELSRLREVERRAKEVIRPFAEYMEDGMDLDNNGLPLPDEQGVGWIYLNHGRFRSARDLYRALSDREGQDG